MLKIRLTEDQIKSINELKILRENINFSEIRFNQGRFNKQGTNTIYLDGKPIVDFGVGVLGMVDIDGTPYEKSIYLKGGYNAASQARGYGAMGVNFIFYKLPKIQHLIMQCYDSACPFWKKMGGKIVSSKDISGSGKLLHTIVINREDFMKSKYNMIPATA